jgi:type II secretory pathway component GspD/PulD (secretin)
VLFALPLALMCACKSSAPDEHAAAPDKPGSELTVQKFQELISQGALKPVHAMEDDPYAQTKPDMEEDVFAKAVERLKTGETPEAARPEQPAADAAKPAEPPNFFPENPYLKFGKRIQVYPESGLIMKPFPLKIGTGKPLLELIKTYGFFPLYDAADPKAGVQTPPQVRLDLKEKWDSEMLVPDLRAPTQVEGASIGLADWLIVTAGFERLSQVEDFINVFAAGVPQIEIEAKIVEVSTTDTLDYGVRPIDTNTPIFGFPDHTFVNQFNYNLPNQANFSTGDALLQLGAVQDGMAFNAILEALATYQNVSINSRPKIAVREGGRAEIINTLQLPYYTVNSIAVNGQVAANLAMVEVGVRLYVIPRVVGTRTVALNIDVEASQEAGSATTFSLQNGQTISNPIIAKRGAKTIVYLEPGQAVILGGLIAERTVDAVSKVPLLGDIPILGTLLFRSTYKKKELTNVLFFIRPRILQGSDLHTEF